MNKRGDQLIETIMFIMLNLIFFASLFYFVYRTGNSAIAYEQSYAKEIALLIDNAKPGTNILLNVQDGLKIAKDSGQDLSRMFSARDNKVFVDLTGKGSYSSAYFSDYNVEINMNGNGFAYIQVKEKE